MSAETNENSVVNEAREMGWVEKDEFKGDISKWVPAEEYVEHGRRVLPILQKGNQKLLAEQASLRQQVAGLQENLATFEEFHKEEVIRRVEAAKREFEDTKNELLSRLKDAKNNQDVDEEVRLTDQLSVLNAAKQAEDGKAPNEAKAPPQTNLASPELSGWLAKHPLMDKDPAFTHRVMAIGFELKEEQPNLLGQAFFDELDARLEEETPKVRQKVESSRGGRTQRVADGKTYDDLPKEAKEVCDRYAKKFAGPNKQWKTPAEYRKHYVEMFDSTGGFQT